MALYDQLPVYKALMEIEHTLAIFHNADRECLEDIRASLNSYLGIMKHYRTYNIKRKVLRLPHNRFYQYGYLGTHLGRYCLKRVFQAATRV